VQRIPEGGANTIVWCLKPESHAWETRQQARLCERKERGEAGPDRRFPSPLTTITPRPLPRHLFAGCPLSSNSSSISLHPSWLAPRYIVLLCTPITAVAHALCRRARSKPPASPLVVRSVSPSAFIAVSLFVSLSGKAPRKQLATKAAKSAARKQPAVRVIASPRSPYCR
jgi:hypothetical protein